MKTLLTSLLSILIISISFAEGPITKGTINLDGTISLSSTTYEDRDDTYATIQLNPQIGLFIVDNFSIGISINYLSNSVNDNETYEWGIGPNSRYYFNLEKIYPFIGVGYLFSQIGFSEEDESIKADQLVLSGGIDVFVTESVAIETFLSYTLKTLTYPKGFVSSREEEVKSKTIFFGVGINVFI